MSTGTPYTKKALEDLAVALGVDTAYLWVDPVTNSLGLRERRLLEETKESDVKEQTLIDE